MVFWKSFLSLYDFWAQKCKNQLFEESNRFERSFYLSKLQICLVDLKKTHQTLDILLMKDFFYNLKKKKIIFRIS